jgi:cell division transport system permease protein
LRSIKNHLSLIIALTTLLAAFQSVAVFSQVTNDYEIALGDEYAIVVVAKKPLELSEISALAPQAVALEPIDSALILDEVKDALSDANLAYLKNAMPRFYSLRLSSYPSSEERENIERQLAKNDSIVRVETFAKTQDRLYRLLLLIKTMLLALAALMFVVAFLMIVRQMEVWRFEHSKRVNIMAIFGAPLLLRSAALFRLAIVDSFFSSLIVGGLFYYLSADSMLKNLLNEVGLGGIRYDLITSSLTLFGAALAISLSGVLFVILKAEETQ